MIPVAAASDSKKTRSKKTLYFLAKSKLQGGYLKPWRRDKVFGRWRVQQYVLQCLNHNAPTNSRWPLRVDRFLPRHSCVSKCGRGQCGIKDGRRHRFVPADKMKMPDEQAQGMTEPQWCSSRRKTHCNFLCLAWKQCDMSQDAH